MPSIFDNNHSEERQGYFSLENLVDAIAILVTRDGERGHVDYIPSQVVCEFFAHDFRDHNKVPLNGMYIPVLCGLGAKNDVIFPSRAVRDQWEDRVKLQIIEHHSFHDWDKLKKAI